MDHDVRAQPLRKKALVSTVAVFGLLAVSAAAYPFLSSLSPSERTKNNAEFAFPIPDLREGQPLTLHVNGRPLLLLRPDAHQLESIAKLDQDVWHADRDNWVPELNAFAYWGIGSPFGCELQNVPVGDSTFLPPSYHHNWLGGYWDPRCEVSYDYAGRAIRSPDRAFNGFAPEVPNLRRPQIETLGDTLLVSLHGE